MGYGMAFALQMVIQACRLSLSWMLKCSLRWKGKRIGTLLAGKAGCRSLGITCDWKGAILDALEKCSVHCMHENSFVDPVRQRVTLEPSRWPPESDKKALDETLAESEKKNNVSDCQWYIGQLRWLPKARHISWPGEFVLR